jgi:RNA polymerase sigma factor (TIGR02999 family)
MSDVTRILSQIESGDPRAAEELLPLVYEELRKLATARMTKERADHTLSATALVHEAYVRLVDVDLAQHWDSRGHFFSAAAEAMRRILIDSARRKKFAGKAHEFQRETISRRVDSTKELSADEWLDLNEGIDALADESPQLAELVKLRIFAGLSLKEAGEVLGWPTSTAHARWKFAAAWLERKTAPS